VRHASAGHLNTRFITTHKPVRTADWAIDEFTTDRWITLQHTRPSYPF
jgi:hypothetical protein